MNTAIEFMAYMVKHPTAHMNELTELFEALPDDEKLKIKEAFIAVTEEKETA